MNIMKMVAVGGAGLMFVVGAGCGGDKDERADDVERDEGSQDTDAGETEGESSGGDAGDACRFITVDEASALLGEDVAEPTQVETPAVGDEINAAAACTYRGAQAGIQVVLSTVDDESDFVPDENAIDVGAESVSGIGDDAIISDGAFGLISVRVGLDVVNIFPSRPDRDITRDELLELGRAAAERM
jgi:hypothetical protein